MTTRHHIFRELGERPANFIISANALDYNLYNAYVAAVGTPSGAVNVLLSINSGVILTPTMSNNAALTIGAFPAGSIVTLQNAGIIVGFQGVPGGGGDLGGSPPGSGNNGGDAISTNTDLVISNQYGYIWGGGGGGGGGGSYGAGTGLAASGGDGGAGAGAYYYFTGSLYVPGYQGANGGNDGSANSFGQRGGRGGDGGDYGSTGSGGSNTTTAGGGFPGGGGNAVRKNGRSVTFTDGNNASQVRGAVA